MRSLLSDAARDKRGTLISVPVEDEEQRIPSAEEADIRATMRTVLTDAARSKLGALITADDQEQVSK